MLITLVMLLAGTTFAGHDWNTGSMGNQLLFEPRRARVWAAKLAAVVLAGGGLALAVLVAYWTGLYAVASARDLPIPDHAMVAAYKQAVLGTIFVAGAAAFGYVLTMLLRSTVGTLGLLFATGFLGLVVVGALGIESAEQVMPWGNFWRSRSAATPTTTTTLCVLSDDGVRPGPAHRPAARDRLLPGDPGRGRGAVAR